MFNSDILFVNWDVLFELPFRTTNPDAMVKWSNKVASRSENRLSDSILRNNKGEKEGVFRTMLSTLRALARTFVGIGIRMPSQLGSTKVHGNWPARSGLKTNERSATKLESHLRFESREQIKAGWLSYQWICINTATLISRALGDVTVSAICISTRTAKVHLHRTTSTLPVSHCIDLKAR